MGFMDKLKSMKNMVTGGGAKVTLQLGPTALGQPISVMVRAQIEGAPINATKVYVAVRGTETVELTHNDGGQKKKIQETEQTFTQEFAIQGPVQLAANSQHEWQGQIMIPPTAPPSYRGKHARHEWFLLAALDVAGNDPDSGWIEIQLR